MSHLDIKIHHELSQEEALLRIKNELAGLKAQYGARAKNVTEEWDHYDGRIHFSVMGFSISIKIFVGIDTVRMGSRLPLLLSMYKKKISAVIEKRGGELFSKATKVA